ncbi:MAG TPA: YggT family protein [Candidatus Acidoferrum sp.]|nr:YggT family protein [Candidatus Acidoferrum sp.]
MSSNIVEALSLIISKIGGIYAILILLRFLLQAARADFYNPVCQTIVKLTSPLLNPLRRVIPGWRRLDIAALVLALLLSSCFTELLIFINYGALLSPGKVVSWALVGLIALTLNIYFYAMVVMVVASFIMPLSGHPILLAIYQLMQPFYRIAHRIIPPIGGLDFSPVLLMIAIQVVEILVLNPLAQGLRVMPSVVIGL